MKSCSTRGFLTWEALLGFGIFAMIALPLTGFLARVAVSMRSSEKMTQAPRVAEMTFQEFQASPGEISSGTLSPIVLTEKTYTRSVSVTEVENGSVVEVLLRVKDTSQPETTYAYQTRIAKL